MKMPAAMVSTVLALLLAGAVEAQTQAPRTPPGSTRPAMVGRPPIPVRPPSFVRPQFFFRHPFFFGSDHLFASPASFVSQTYVYSYAYPVYVQSPVYDQPQTQYWAYCRSPQGYYPYVSDCRAGWLPVVPTSAPPPLVPGPTGLDAGQQPKDPPGGGDSIEEIRARIARSRAD
jgi:hypothetical protein